MSQIFPNPPAPLAAQSNTARGFAQPFQLLVTPNSQTVAGALGCVIGFNNQTTPIRSNASFFERLPRLEASNAAPASPAVIMGVDGSVASSRPFVREYGAFNVSIYFGIPQLPNDNKTTFAGLTSQGSVASFIALIDPTDYTNAFGFGLNGGQTTFRIISRTGAGVATAVDTGIARAANVVYKAEYAAASDGSNINAKLYSVDSFSSSTLLFEETVVATLPTASEFLTWACVGRSTDGSGDGSISVFGVYGDRVETLPI